jgi:hypothetical protein
VNSGFDVISWILPRAHDFNVANQYFMIRGSLGSGVDELAAQAGAPEVAWVTMLISSAALIVAMVSFSCWIFSRRDN